MSKRIQPAWIPPKCSDRAPLMLYNSLTRKKEKFIPKYKNRVLWYSCGPTVYDASHMGHARSYISFDILRRVLSDYFGYDVFYVMNITDVDDKIIKRARHNFLYEEYIKNTTNLDSILEDAKSVMLAFGETVTTTTDNDKKIMQESLLEKAALAMKNLEKVIKVADENEVQVNQKNLLEAIKDPLSEWLDKKYGANITDYEIFNKLSRHWESEFHKDMDALNVLQPNVLTRVSEYIPEIVQYIMKIINNGLAYESNGSVYFDVESFDKREKHRYAKLVPEAYGDASSLQEGEGDLCLSEERLSEKRAPTDFALWKSSKAGEPSWESPWGKGRPGWHIECSVMASEICGNLDIHTGGVDLKFPHHDNELAQAEAYYDESDWVKYFLHSGHLTISGCKMSKSLKNFITIQEALKKNSARQLRIAFLLHSWKDTLDYSANTMEMAMQYEKYLNEFFLNVKCEIRFLQNKSIDAARIFPKWEDNEMELNKKYFAAKDKVHNALCDNIDTRTALDAIRDLIGQCNIYMQKVNSQINSFFLRDIAIYITQIFKIFGVISSSSEEVGFAVENKIDVENVVNSHLQILADFRDKIRGQAKEIKATTILQECDKLRDEVLPNVGVRLEDVESGGSKIKLVNKDELLKEREAKKLLEANKILEKERKKVEAAATAAAKEQQRRIAPSEMFKMETDKYSQFDDKGLPTHDCDGKELSKGLLKKLQKLQITQEKKYNEYMSTSI